VIRLRLLYVTRQRVMAVVFFTLMILFESRVRAVTFMYPSIPSLLANWVKREYILPIYFPPFTCSRLYLSSVLPAYYFDCKIYELISNH
jgi:hypothetical protein